MMRVATIAVMLLLAACSFDSPGAGGSGGDDDGGDGGGDGPNQPPACPDGDDDGDLACNGVDRCAGHDDRLDVDSDGTADGCDDWPCGLMKPDDPGGFMSDSGGQGRDWGATFIDIGDSRRVAAPPGQPFSARFTWGLVIDCGPSQACLAQVEIGYGASRVGCVFEGTVPDRQLVNGNFDAQLTAPTMPGVYEIRLNAGRAQSCGSGMAWFGGDPGPESTIAILCVR